MASANHTYGVNATVLGAYLAQIGMGGANHQLNGDGVTQLVRGAASEFNALAEALGVDIDAINTAGSGVAYDLAQRAVAYLAIPDILTAFFDTEAADKAAEVSRKRAERLLDRFTKTPRMLVASDGDEVAGRASTSVRLLGVPTTDTARRRRFRWKDDGSGGGRPW